MAVYGICGDTKCRIEVEPKSDTGWVTLAEAGTHGVFTLSEPLEYRIIKNRVYWRTRIQSVKSGSPPASQYEQMFGTNGVIPTECVPAKDVQKTFVLCKYGDTAAYTLNIRVYASNLMKFHIYSTSTITTTDLDASVGIDYLVD